MRIITEISDIISSNNSYSVKVNSNDSDNQKDDTVDINSNVNRIVLMIAKLIMMITMSIIDEA